RSFLMAVQLAPDHGGEPTVVVLGAGEAVGVVVVDAQKQQGAVLAELPQTVRQHPAHLLGRVARRLDVRDEVVPKDGLLKPSESLPRDLVECEAYPDRTIGVEALVKAVLSGLTCGDRQRGVEGERRRVPELPPTIDVGRAVLPSDETAG